MASSSSSQTSSSSASSPPHTRWDVFLSFSGIDAHYPFTDHLYNALLGTGIQTYLDDPELRSGEVISDSLLQVIKDSKTYIVVFSENYASSRWCLDVLVEILDCHKSLGRLVIPVFHKIEPSAVRHQTGSFKTAFEKYDTGSVGENDKVNKLCLALRDAASLKGHHISETTSEADVVNTAVDRVLLEITSMTLDVAKYPVGLDPRVKDIISLLSSDSGGVIRIGIYGMGGVGKTTLAKAVYNHIYRNFGGSCFLANVREASGTKGLVSLQKQLISCILKSKNIEIHNVEQGLALIRDYICLTKVLIVVDDLDNAMELEYLEGPFALGSIIIISTRNEDLLDSIEVQAKYKVNELDDSESHLLFIQHAFHDNKVPDSFMELIQEILELAGGLPLALKVYGSKLRNKSEEEWRWFIDKVKRVPIYDVETTLMISFDTLKSHDPMLCDIFLDIACFFTGWKEEEVVKIMETYYDRHVSHFIDILKRRCLLTIDNTDELEMHHLLRDMGRKIVCNNSPRDPENHSRLWLSKDIYNVLERHMGTEVITGIVSSKFDYQDALEGVSFTTQTFQRMSNLRFLYLKHANLTGSFEGVFKHLSWFRWDRCPLMCLPFDFCPQKLVMLELPHSKMRTVWELNKVPQVFENLRTLNMSYSLDLTTTPDFIMLPNLETLYLEGCKSLEEVHTSIGSLARLVSLDLAYCNNLRSLPDSICHLRALKSLNIVSCNNLKALPTKLGNIKSLEELNAEGLTVCELPDSIGCLSKLVELNLKYSKNLKTLPNSICNLRALEILSIADCCSIKGLPTKLGNIESLKKLNAKGLTVRTLPESIGLLSMLVELRLSYNKNLKILPDTICKLRSLEILCIDYCSGLETLPTQLGNIVSLKELNAEGLTVRTLPDSVGLLSKLVVLRLSYNWNLEALPNTIWNLRALKTISIDYCSSLKTLPIELRNIESLKELSVW